MSTGEPNQISVATKKGRPSPVQEAEDYRNENDVNKTKVEAKNVLKNHCVTMRSTSIVEKLRSKFEVGHKKEIVEDVHARNRSDKNRWERNVAKQKGPQYPQDAQERADLTNQRQIPTDQSVQKTVEVPKVQYIDEVAVDMQRHVSTIQASQHIDEVVHVPALTQSEVPTIPDADDLCLDEIADEDRLEHENKKRELPMPAEAVFESRADGRPSP